VPAYVASRVTEEWWALPEVEVRGVPARGWWREGRADDRLRVVREAVVEHFVEGLRGELVRELMELGVEEELYEEDDWEGEDSESHGEDDDDCSDEGDY
jgi:hypothetical protein